MKKGLKHTVTISPTLPSLPVCVFGPIQSSVWSVGRGREAWAQVHRCVCVHADRQHQLKVDSCDTKPISGTSLKDGSEGDSSQGQELEQCPACLFYSEGQMTRLVIINRFKGGG